MLLTSPARPTPSIYWPLHHRKSPHTGEVCVMSVSTGGRWILTSSNGQTYRMFVLTDAWDLNFHVILDTGHAWVTCVTWASGLSFYAGCSDGRVFLGELQMGKQMPMSLSLVYESPIPMGVITAIAYSQPSGHIALSTAREVVLLHRRNLLRRYVAGGAEAAGGRNDHEVICCIEPFRGTETSINCLAFYGSARFNLVVGCTSGLAIYAVYFMQAPRYIAGNCDYKIARCAISNDDNYLAVSTLDHRLVHWDLEIEDSVIRNPVVIDQFNTAANPCSIQYMAITAANVLVGGTSDGRIHFINLDTWQRHASKSPNNNRTVRAMAMCGPRLYIMDAADSDPSRVHISAYTRDKLETEFIIPEDVMLRQPGFKPHIGLLNQRTQGLNTEPSTNTPPHPTPGCHLCLLVAITIFLIPIITFLYVCVFGIKEITSELPHAPYGSRLASVGVYLIYTYLPSSWRAPADSVLVVVLCVYRLLVRLFV
ncbi:hypothetical protein FRC08_004924 [Ceratobasidium sp. 394]|nr:hypothetical protein FRC08_004924 [Ceratobasidium sp. 394]